MKNNLSMENQINQILIDVKNQYKSLESPDFNFVQRVYEQNPYHDLIDLLASKKISLEEDTDINDDVSFGYSFKTKQDEYILRISMVEKYAVLMKIDEDNNILRVVDKSNIFTTIERNLMLYLESKNIILLNIKILETPIKIKLFNADQENTRIYQALFTDTDILPWE